MPESENQIGFDQLGLGSVLKRYRLVVPPNQREYSWTEIEVNTLFQDFAKAITEGSSIYFLGTIVTIPRQDGTLEVVDGQQRLATTAIFLACVRDYLHSTDQMVAEAIASDFIASIDRKRREMVPRLSLNLDDNDFFKALLTNESKPEPGRESHRNILSAFALAKARVKTVVNGLPQRDHGDVLNRWVDFIEHRALVVLLRVPNDGNAYKMFETLNDRGLKTSQSDLVKNYLFGTARDRFAEVQQKWALMRGALESLGSDDITIDFLRHAIITMHGFTREQQVFERVQEIAKSPQPVVTFVTELENLSNFYVAIHNPEHEKWNGYPDSARRAMVVLNLFNIRPMRPLMLAIARKFSMKEASEAFKFLVVLSVRLLIAATTRSASVEGPLAVGANKVFTEDFKTSRDLKKHLRGIMPTDEEFKRAFETATVSATKLARYYIRSLEMVAKGESEPWHVPNDDRQVINLEHVLPRKTEGNWPEFAEEEAASYVNRLGNLALLQASSNSGARSAGFEEKRELYARSPYVLTKQLADVERWDSVAISDRQRVLAEYALKAWPV